MIDFFFGGREQGRLEFPALLGMISKADAVRRKIEDLSLRMSSALGLPITPNEVMIRFFFLSIHVSTRFFFSCDLSVDARVLGARAPGHC